MVNRTYAACLNEVCARPMRPRGASAESAPGTVAMGYKGQCKTCVQPRTRPRRPRQSRLRPSEDARITCAVNGLQSFLARRYARGIAPEATPSIAYRPVLAVIVLMPAAEQLLVAA